jgi:hypothetical protein
MSEREAPLAALIEERMRPGSTGHSVDEWGEQLDGIAEETAEIRSMVIYCHCMKIIYYNAMLHPWERIPKESFPPRPWDTKDPEVYRLIPDNERSRASTRPWK